MAAVLGCPEDAVHWNETVVMSGLQAAIECGWEQGAAGMFGDTSAGITFPNLAPAANTAFPRDWVRTMAETWMDDSVSAVILFILLLCTTLIFVQVKGFYGKVPLTGKALQDWVENVHEDFAVVPGDILVF